MHDKKNCIFTFSEENVGGSCLHKTPSHNVRVFRVRPLTIRITSVKEFQTSFFICLNSVFVEASFLQFSTWSTKTLSRMI